MNRFARDSRKWNVRVLLSSQIPADFLRIQGFVSLLDSVFVGRLDDDAAQADALRLLKVPIGAGYEQVVASLGRRPAQRTELEKDRAPRQFIFADGTGGVERIRADFSGPHMEQFRTVMDTTPDAMRDPGRAADAAQQRAPEPEPQQPPAQYADADDNFELEADFELGLTEEPVGEPVGGGGKKPGQEDAA
jgi:hypothetical protein